VREAPGPDLTLAEARAMIDRALEKARELRQAGTITVVDGGGNLVSVSRTEGSPPAAVQISRAKAYLAAIMQAPTAGFSTRMDQHPVRYAAYQAMLPDKTFPGPGGMPVRKDERAVGGIATAAGISPVTEIPGVDPGQLMVDGVRANAEDLVISYALQIPYENQHAG
jgi:uncharacterized protein GlcG (DUF336 family)